MKKYSSGSLCGFWQGKTCLIVGFAIPLALPTLAESNDTVQRPIIDFAKRYGQTIGYYTTASYPGDPRELDRFGDAVIHGVTYAQMGGENEVTLVLFSVGQQLQVRAYVLLWGEFEPLENLQPLFKRLIHDGAVVDLSSLQQALASPRLPLDLTLMYEPTQVWSFDVLDHTQGTLVGFYDRWEQPLPLAAGLTSRVYYYKKTFATPSTAIITATYRRLPGVAGRFALLRLAEETEPIRFTGSEEGLALGYGEPNAYRVSQVYRGFYTRGRREGEWLLSDYGYFAQGNYTQGVRQGEWMEVLDSLTYRGRYQDDRREGEWLYWTQEDQPPRSGYETYRAGRLNGISEFCRGREVLGRVLYQDAQLKPVRRESSRAIKSASAGCRYPHVVPQQTSFAGGAAELDYHDWSSSPMSPAPDPHDSQRSDKRLQ